MKNECKHTHKDDPDNAVCEDCYEEGLRDKADHDLDALKDREAGI